MKYSPSQNAFYAEDLTYSRLPDDLVTITEAEHQALFDARATGKSIEARDGAPAAVDPPVPDITEGDVRREAARRIKERVAAENGGHEYALEEMLTWPEQTLAAIEYAEDESPSDEDHPFLAALAAGRGITTAQMAARIAAKRAVYMGIAMPLFAKQAEVLAMDPIPTDYTDDKWWT